MLNAKPLPWYLRLMYLLPVFLCVAITTITIVKYSKIGTISIISSPSSPGADLDEETRRAQEILKQQRQQQLAEET